jgi:hypothetical protein
MGLFFVISFAPFIPVSLQERSDRISGLFPPVLQPLSQKFEKFQEKPLYIPPFVALKCSRAIARIKKPPISSVPIPP